MDEIKIGITPEDIERQLVDAIVKSSIGARIKTVLDSEVLNLSKGWHNTFDRAIDQVILDAVRDTLLKCHMEQIKAIVAKQLTDERIEKITIDLLEKLRSRY